MLNIFKKKTVYKFKTSKALSCTVHQDDTNDQNDDTNDQNTVHGDAVRYVAKHAKKQFRWARKGDSGKEYHYYLDEKHMTYMDLAWPEFTERWRQFDFCWDSVLVSLVKNWDPVLISLIRRSMPNLVAFDLAAVQPMTGPHKKGKK